jgi:hypothetical protein
MEASEQERATFYQEHKDDPDVWEEGESRDSPRQRKSLSITVRLTPEESDLLRETAKAKEVSYAEVIREALKLYAGSSRLLVERIWSADYRIGLSPKIPQPMVEKGPGFKESPKLPTRTFMPAST